jgi:transcriptional regulator with XRE-family HTH domain
MAFSVTITTLRRKLGLTQAELARLLDVDKQSVSNWECGRNAPWPERQADILEHLAKLGAVAPPPGRPSINERILRP